MLNLSFFAMRLPFPVIWRDIFERAAPLVVEIGFGDGKFLAGLAAQHPELNFVGIERAHAPMSWTEKRILREGQRNVRLIFGEAFMALNCLFEPASVHAFHINFSDPWHKRRHHERRLIDAEFLQALVSRLESPGGQLLIATDIEHYALQIEQALRETSGIENAYPTSWITERENRDVITRYEGRAIEEGRTCHYFKWQRTAEPVPALPVTKLDEEPMPNATIFLPVEIETITAQFEPLLSRYADRVAKLRSIYQHQNRPQMMVEAIIDEPLFNQHLMILIQQKAPHEYLIRMAEMGYPRATDGVHDAVYTLMQWLLSLHPEARLIQHKLKFPQAQSLPDETE